MKTLYFLRHAKSDWNNFDLSDHERPLNARGRGACEKTGRLLRKRGFTPGRVLCSSAVRARETLDAVMFAAECTWSITLEPKLYGASADGILGLIRQQSDAANSLFLVGHNPGFQDLVVGLTGREKSEGTLARVTRKMPTAGFAELSFDTDSFKNIGVGTGYLVDFFKPKDKTIV